MKARITIFFLVIFANVSFLYPQIGTPLLQESIREGKKYPDQIYASNTPAPGFTKLSVGSEAVSAAQSSGGATSGQTYMHTPGSFFYESFEEPVFPPAGWNTVNVKGYEVWHRVTNKGIAGSCSASIDAESGEDGKGIDWLITPRFSVSAGDSLTFQVRPVNAGSSYPPDTLYIKLSFDEDIPVNPSDVEASFTETILKISTKNLLRKFNRYAVSMDAYAGRQVYIGFREYNENSCGVFIDAITFGKQKNIDINVYSMDSFSAIEKNQTITPKAIFQNLGYTDLTFLDVYMEISPSGYISHKTIGINSLTTMESIFDDWTPPASGKYTIRAYAVIPGDEDMNNNSLTGEIGVIRDMTWTGWHSEKPMPEKRAYHGEINYVKRSPTRGVPDTGFVYVIGGNPVGVDYNYINKYNTLSRKWTSVKQLPEEFNTITTVQIKGKIYIPGGKNSDALTSSLYIYDINTGAFTKGADVPIPVEFYSIGSYGDSLIYVFGGLKNLTPDVKTEISNTVQIYNVNRNSWSSGTPLPEFGGWAMGGGIAGDQIVLIGSGENGLSVGYSQSSDQVFFGEINSADPYRIKWTTGKFPGGAISYAAGSAVYDKDKKYVFITGGVDDSGFRDATWAYNLNDQLWERAPNKISACYASQLTPLMRNDSLFVVSAGGYGPSDALAVNEWLYVGPYNPFEKVDAAAVSVDCDTATLNKPYTPKATFTNVGPTTGSVIVKMEITPGSYVSVDTIDALAYNSITQVSFANWTPKAAGKYAVKIYADNWDDKNFLNDTLTSYVFVKKQGMDVAPYSADFDTVYAYIGNVLKATFINKEKLTQTFPVKLEITPGGFTAVDTIKSLTYNATKQINFGSWTPSSSGTYNVKIYSSLPGDEDLTNDTLKINLTVRSPKVDVASVSVDFDTAMAYTAYVPKATFTNLEHYSQNVPVTMEINPGAYKGVYTISSLAYNVKQQVSFSSWMPSAAGTYKVKIYTSVPNDRNLHNDTLTANIIVKKRGIDVASYSIDIDTVYAYMGNVPKATFINKDTVTQSFPVRMEITPGGYLATAIINNLAYTKTKQVSFNTWTPAATGTYKVKIYSVFPKDEDKTNDTLVTNIIVKDPKADAASVSVDFDTVVANTPYVPKATFTNLEQYPQNVLVTMEINPGAYKNVYTISSLAYNVKEQVSFPSWTPGAAGTYKVKIYTSVPNDLNLHNDTLTADVIVKRKGIDVASYSVDFDTVIVNTPFIPKATFINKDQLTQTFQTTMEIIPGGYVGTSTVNALSYNATSQVSFGSWTPTATGTYKVKIYTSLPGDEDTSNDTLTVNVVVRKPYIDAASVSIDFDTVVVNMPYVPKATFANLEKQTQDVIVTMEINPGSYINVDTITSLAYNNKEQVSFPSWTPTATGTYKIKIYTYVPNDQNLSNDTLTANVIVRNRGIDVSSFSVDFDTVEVKTKIVPRATFANKLIRVENVIVTMEINPGAYVSVDTIPALEYGAHEQISFAPWTPDTVGTYKVKIYTFLLDDENVNNDTLTSNLIVRTRGIDAASFSIDFDTVSAEKEFIPKATFTNKDRLTQTFITTMEINPGGYVSVDTVESLPYNAKRQVSFAPWIPANIGTYNVKIYTSLAGDEDLSNDTLTSHVLAKKILKDVASISVDFDTVSVKTPYVPKATFANFEQDPQTFVTTMEINPGGYISVDTVKSLPYYGMQQVSFKSWTPEKIGAYTVKIYTYLPGDNVLSNDTLKAKVTVKKLGIDAAAYSIDFDTVFVNEKFIPQATFTNKEVTARDVDVRLEINPGGYAAIDTIYSLKYGEKQQVSFKSWTPSSIGVYTAKIYTSLPGDEVLNNDTLTANIIVKNLGVDVAAYSIDFDTVVVKKEFAPTATFMNKDRSIQPFVTTVEISPGGYVSADTVKSLAYKAKKQVSFKTWTPDSVGVYTVKAYTYLAGDENLINDTLTAQIVVRNVKKDAASVSINFDTLIVGKKFIPKAIFENKGSASQKIIAAMEINSQKYKSIDTISLLAPNARRQVSFTAWTPESVGQYTVTIFTSLPGDEDTSNDTLTATVSVRNIEKDVASFSVDFDTIIVNRMFVPKATFINMQFASRTFLVTMKILPSGYIRTDTVKSLSHNEKKQVAFYPWIPDKTQIYTIQIYTSLPGDENLTNDTLFSQAVVKNIERDVAPFSVDFDTVIVNKSFIPKATFINTQPEIQTFITTMKITPGNYLSIDTVKALSYKEKRQVIFAPWIPDSAGNFTVAVYTSLMYDDDLSNDTLKTYAAVVRSIVPAEYSLLQNYPNPFNPSTTIRYGIPKTGLVELKVFNILGQEVITLVNEIKEAGSYEVKFNASGMGLASGIYFYRIKAGDFARVKKLMLIK